MEEKRFFSFKDESGEIVKMVQRRPNNKEIEAADVEFSKVFYKAIKNGLPTRSVLTKTLEENGLWTEADNKEIEDIELKIVALSGKKVKGKEKERIDEEIQILQEKANQARRVRNDYFGHSAESKASDAQRDYLVSCVTDYQESGERVWKDLDSFLEETDGNILFRATYEYLTFSNNMDSGLVNEEGEEKKEEKEVKTAEKVEVASDKDADK